MAPVTINFSGMQHGILSDETNINIEAFTQELESKKYEIPNKLGCTRGICYFDQKMTGSYNGEVLATPTYAIGDPITFANLMNLGGITTGVCCTDKITANGQREKALAVTIAFSRYPLVTGGS